MSQVERNYGNQSVSLEKLKISYGKPEESMKTALPSQKADCISCLKLKTGIIPMNPMCQILCK